MNLGGSSNPILCMTQGAALYSGAIMDTGVHSHHAIQIVLSEKEKFQICLKGDLFSASAVIIDSDVDHELLASGVHCIFFYVEPESEFGRRLKEKMQDEYEFFDDHKNLHADLVRSCAQRPSVMEFRKIVEQHWHMPKRRISFDPRIGQVLNLIDGAEFKKTRISGLAGKIGISESRLQHLFKEQVGISIRKYLLWKRIVDGINFAVRGRDFSTSAFEAGFADGAHMSRTFKAMFGINLSDFFSTKQPIQIFFEEIADATVPNQLPIGQRSSAGSRSAKTHLGGE